MVYVVDDDASMCELLASALGRAGLEVRTFPSAEAFVEADLGAECRSSPCCLLLDLVLPGQSGLEYLAKHVGKLPCPVIMITARGSVSDAVQAMKLGAVDVLEKPSSTPVLTQVVRATLTHHQDMITEALAREQVRGYIARLTPRERELLDGIVRGRSSKMIADRLGISVRTVDHHRAHVMEKMRAANAADLVRMALKADYKSVKPAPLRRPAEPLPPTPK
jgi:FixJ family two-component response regulator